jgi:hypothetical protein
MSWIGFARSRPAPEVKGKGGKQSELLLALKVEGMGGKRSELIAVILHQVEGKGDEHSDERSG